MPHPTPTTPLTIPHAYHALLKHTLLAISFSTPARHTVLSVLRRSFRLTTPANQAPLTTFDPVRITNTLHFLSLAALPRTLERRVLKSLIHTWYWQDADRARGRRPGVVLGRGGHKGHGIVMGFGEQEKSGREEGRKGMERKTKSGRLPEEEARIRLQGERVFEAMVAGLNESMGLCLPVR